MKILNDELNYLWAIPVVAFANINEGAMRLVCNRLGFAGVGDVGVVFDTGDLLLVCIAKSKKWNVKYA